MEYAANVGSYTPAPTYSKPGGFGSEFTGVVYRYILSIYVYDDEYL